VRLMTMKDDPSRCKGFAFVDFARYDKMELCLTKFHHSIFNDGISDARKINVELT
jgi:nucleolar protein 6